MLTRHSPLHALGYAEAGWLVGESGGQSRHADCCTTAQVFTQNRSSSSQVTLRRGSRSRPIARRLVLNRLFQCEQKNPRADPRAMPSKTAAVEIGRPRPSRAQPAPSLTGLRETPASRLETSTMVAKHIAPVAAKSAFGGVASCDRTQSSFSKKNLLEGDKFFKNSSDLLDIQTKSGNRGIDATNQVRRPFAILPNSPMGLHHASSIAAVHAN